MKRLLNGFVFSCLALSAGEIARDTGPVTIHQAQPEYTQEAKDHHFEGVVLVSVIVSTEGIPTNIEVRNPPGYGLEIKAVECVRQWRFRPATHDAQPVPARATIELRYKLP